MSKFCCCCFLTTNEEKYKSISIKKNHEKFAFHLLTQHLASAYVCKRWQFVSHLYPVFFLWLSFVLLLICYRTKSSLTGKRSTMKKKNVYKFIFIGRNLLFWFSLLFIHLLLSLLPFHSALFAKNMLKGSTQKNQVTCLLENIVKLTPITYFVVVHIFEWHWRFRIGCTQKKKKKLRYNCHKQQQKLVSTLNIYNWNDSLWKCLNRRLFSRTWQLNSRNASSSNRLPQSMFRHRILETFLAESNITFASSIRYAPWICDQCGCTLVFLPSGKCVKIEWKFFFFSTETISRVLIAVQCSANSNICNKNVNYLIYLSI